MAERRPRTRHVDPQRDLCRGYRRSVSGRLPVSRKGDEKQLGTREIVMTEKLLPTTVVGSYPQPDWLVDRAMLSKTVPRVRMDIWRVPAAWLEQAQDDATLLAIRDMERADIDIITDGEMRRESYSNRFATALEGIDTARTGQV